MCFYFLDESFKLAAPVLREQSTVPKFKPKPLAIRVFVRPWVFIHIVTQSMLKPQAAPPIRLLAHW